MEKYFEVWFEDLDAGRKRFHAITAETAQEAVDKTRQDFHHTRIRIFAVKTFVEDWR